MDPLHRLPEEAPPARRPGVMERALFNEHGFRSGWPAGLFLLLNYFLLVVFGSIAWATGSGVFHLRMDHFGARQAILSELAAFAALLVAAAIASRMEGRGLRGYFLYDKHMGRRLFVGSISGFAALCLLMAGLCLAGVFHVSFGQLSLVENLRFALLWGIAFLLVGLTEEGLFRCFLLSTLARGMSFWWACGTLATLTALLLMNADRHGAGGVYAAALAGIAPCFWLHRRSPEISSFWQAAWVTSTGFGFVHTYNPGETAIGIFSAALIGFTFCVSIRFLGSAWWAIGFHTAWDWAQTYFYGTPDSGLVPEGHLFSTVVTGPAVLSGGRAGPEGSVIVIPVTLLVLALLALICRKRQTTASPLGQPQLS